MSKKDAESALKAFVDVVTDELKKGEKVQLVGFGSFEVAERAAREGINPLTKQPMSIPASKAPKFKAGRGFEGRCETHNLAIVIMDFWSTLLSHIAECSLLCFA